MQSRILTNPYRDSPEILVTAFGNNCFCLANDFIDFNDFADTSLKEKHYIKPIIKKAYNYLRKKEKKKKTIKNRSSSSEKRILCFF